MKTKPLRVIIALAVLTSAFRLAAQGTAFTYQGQLQNNGTPANGTYNLQFSLYANSSGGTPTAAPVTNNGVVISNGLFAVKIDFGAGAFTGATNWLQIAVATNGSSSFTALSPRQQLTPVPYAIFAESANASSGVSLPGQAGLENTSGLFFVPGGSGPFLFGFNGGSLGTLNPTEVNLSWDFSGNVWISNNLSCVSLNVDRAGLNNGGVNSNALTFGISSGEGIASKRTAGYNTFGLDFYTGFINRMSILNNGFVGINTTNPSETLEINGTSRIDDHDLYLRTGTDRNHVLGYRANLLSGPSTNTTLVDGPFLSGFNGGALGFSGPDTMILRWNYFGEVDIYSNLVVLNAASKPGGGSWTALSDARLKKDVQPLAGALDKMLALRGVTFQFKEPEKIHELSGERMGMIAQEVERVFPDWVDTGPEGYKRLTIRGFEALTVEAMRELRAESDRKIGGLEQQLALQKEMNQRTQARLVELEKLAASLAEKPGGSLAANQNRQ